VTSDDDSRSTTSLWPEPGARFAAGDRIGGRYTVRRFVGRGSMGEVYAVRDEELGSDVALKLLRTELHGDGDWKERFKREILLARRVSHPNVCRIYDLGTHALPAERPGGHGHAVLFLTMELLEGETLVDRIERDGPLSEDEAAPIVRQLGEALTAAHTAGVVHRDFKSSNIVLVPGDDGPRAVVTDFGLARENLPSGDDARLTATGGVLGTPAYMSPEQVEGLSADARSDLYAFGVVVYEMLTGHFPFDAESPLAMALQRLREAPAPPERFAPDLSERARAVLRRALERAPEARFGDARELAAAFAGGPVRTAPAKRRRRGLVGLGVAVALGIAGVVIWRGLAPPLRDADPATDAVHTIRPAVAVLPLRNLSGRAESAWLGTALAEMLTSELAAGDALRAVPGETVARALHDLGLGAGEAGTPEALPALRRAAGADLVLGGSYVALGAAGDGKLRVDLRLERPDGAEPVVRRIEGSEAGLFELVGNAGRELREALELPMAPVGGPVLRATLPATEHAVKLYSEGLAALRAGDALGARTRFEAALADDREAPLVWSALSEAWTLLGWSDRALDAAREAYERRESLPRVEALLVEGRYRLANREWDAAIEIGRALWRLFPDDPEHGLRLARALLEAGDSDAALVVIRELMRLPAPAGDDPRIDLLEARVADNLSDPRRQLDAATRAEARAEAAGSRSLLARALYEKALANRKMGHPEEARADLERARRIAAESGDRNWAAIAVQSLAHLVRAEGRLDEAAALYAEARSTFEALGNRQREARAEFSQGLVVYQQGDLLGALALYESALAKLEEVGDRRGAAAALSNIGTALYERGELDAALERHERALAEFRALGDQSRLVVSLQNLAQIRFDRADLDAAEGDLDEALRVSREVEDRTTEGYSLKGLGDLAAERGDAAAAAARYRDAIERFEGAGQEVWKLYAEMALAVLGRTTGDASAAASELARIETELAGAGLTEDRDEAGLQRVRAELAAGRDVSPRETSELLARARESEVQRLRVLERWTRAELLARRGDPIGARRVLEEQREIAERAGLVLVALEANVELARAAAARGETGAAERLAEAKAEAERLGAGRIARRAGT